MPWFGSANDDLWKKKVLRYIAVYRSPDKFSFYSFFLFILQDLAAVALLYTIWRGINGIKFANDDDDLDNAYRLIISAFALCQGINTYSKTH